MGLVMGLVMEEVMVVANGAAVVGVGNGRLFGTLS